MAINRTVFFPKVPWWLLIGPCAQISSEEYILWTNQYEDQYHDICEVFPWDGVSRAVLHDAKMLRAKLRN